MNWTSREVQIVGFSAIVLTLAVGIWSVNRQIQKTTNEIKNAPKEWLEDLLKPRGASYG